MMRIACLLALVFLLGGCAPQPVREMPTACRSPRVLSVVNHGWHTGIVVARSDLAKLLPPLAADIGHEEYVEIGWGEERYYQAREATLGMALRAILAPNPSVLQVVPFTGAPGHYFPKSEIVELWVEDDGYRAALAFVAGSFTRTPEGGVVRLGPSLYGRGWFYRAEGSFHAFNNCNTWIARAVEKTGYPVSATTVTAPGLFSQLRRGGDSTGQCAPVR